MSDGDMSERSQIGGDDSQLQYLLLFVVGVLIGTAARMIIWTLPTSLTERLRKRLLVGYD